MCLTCCSDMNNDNYIKDLQEWYREITNGIDTFTKCNTSSIDYLFICISGKSGNDGQRLGMLVLQEFIKWYQCNQSDQYLPTHGVNKMYPIDMLIEITRLYAIENQFSNQCWRDVLIKFQNIKITNKSYTRTLNILLCGCIIVGLIVYAVVK